MYNCGRGLCVLIESNGILIFKKYNPYVNQQNLYSARSIFRLLIILKTPVFKGLTEVTNRKPDRVEYT
jgi:hypothetical protein